MILRWNGDNISDPIIDEALFVIPNSPKNIFSYP